MAWGASIRLGLSLECTTAEKFPTEGSGTGETVSPSTYEKAAPLRLLAVSRVIPPASAHSGLAYLAICMASYLLF